MALTKINVGRELRKVMDPKVAFKEKVSKLRYAGEIMEALDVRDTFDSNLARSLKHKQSLKDIEDIARLHRGLHSSRMLYEIPSGSSTNYAKRRDQFEKVYPRILEPRSVEDALEAWSMALTWATIHPYDMNKRDLPNQSWGDWAEEEHVPWKIRAYVKQVAEAYGLETSSQEKFEPCWAGLSNSGIEEITAIVKGTATPKQLRHLAGNHLSTLPMHVLKQAADLLEQTGVMHSGVLAWAQVQYNFIKSANATEFPPNAYENEAARIFAGEFNHTNLRGMKVDPMLQWRSDKISDSEYDAAGLPRNDPGRFWMEASVDLRNWIDGDTGEDTEMPFFPVHTHRAQRFHWLNMVGGKKELD